ncbi:MAG: hypothetical protein ABI620_03495 [Chloroflexota bacterium]
MAGFVDVSGDAPPLLALSPLPGPSALVDDPSLAAPSADDELPADLERAPLVDDRSFFAQPEPLKWTVGVDNAFFIVPSAPQEGQNRGPASLMAWMTSVTCRQFEQR